MTKLNELLLNGFEPCAEWSNNCQGKKDYDGRLLSISTRYWPASPTSLNAYDTKTGKWSEVPYGGTPSASAAIHINFGEPDQYGYGDYATLVEKEFSAPTEAEVKALVEAWVKETCETILTSLKHVFPQ